MLVTKEDFYWESRHGQMYLCFNNNKHYRDITVMSIDPICLKSYIWFVVQNLKKDSKVLYIHPLLSDDLIYRDWEWLSRRFRSN